jgi:two-component system cell cycle sensor histidine kinase/response regulator CckA
MVTESSGPIVLIVEDDELVRELIELGLQRDGYRLLLAAEAEQALQLADTSAEPIDLIVADVNLPGRDGDGRQLAAQIGQRHPNARVLFISGAPEVVPLRDAGGRPASFLHKPFTPSVLREAARAALGWKK